jgi:hypothetical protein
MLQVRKKTRADYRMVSEDDPQWRRFWDAYPKRVSKKEARKAWAHLQPDAATVDQMLATLAWQCQQPGWVKDGGQFVPYPASWLRDARWEDEPPTKLGPSGGGQAGAAARGVLETLLGGGHE